VRENFVKAPASVRDLQSAFSSLQGSPSRTLDHGEQKAVEVFRVHCLRSRGRRERILSLINDAGETAALGFVDGKPVLLLPGRLDAALSVWLTVGRRLLARLAGALNKEYEPVETVTLARKVASTVGLAEVVPVRRSGGQADPLATKYLPLSVIARADGWLLVPADSEGYSAGSTVQVRPWP
jgi:hypothetical protein